MSPAQVVLILSLLLGIQPVTTDLYLPALPALTQGFAAPVSQAQLTLTALLLAFGASQLVWGPLSDRFGRRPILLAGMTAYTLASVASALAPSMAWLIAARTLQGAAMGAAVMCARAIVRDLHEPADAARTMSRALSGLGLIALVCPMLGGVITDVSHWRVALMVLAVFGGLTLWLVASRFAETAHARNPRALEPAVLLRTWRQILRHPTFWAWNTLSTASYGGLFTFLAASSFVFIETLGLTRTQYGMVMATTSLVYIGGTVACRRLLPRLGVRRTVALAACFTLSGGVLLAVLAHAGVRQPWALMLPLCLYMLAHGVHQPCGQSGAVGPFPHAAGAASALNGFIMMLAAFATGGWLGRALQSGTVLPLAHGLLFWSSCIALSAWVLVRRHGEAGAAPQVAVPRA